MKSKTKIIIIAFLSALLLAAMTLVLALSNFGVSVHADDAELSEVSIADETFMLGETINIPEASFNYKGEEYVATAVTEFPDGKVKQTKSISLDVVGRYTVVYSAYAEEKFLSKDIHFDVKGTAFDISGINSSAIYGQDTTSYNTGKRGIMLSLAASETFTYNALVDLNSFTAEDPAVSLFLLPQRQGEYDARKLYIRFTDAYDPNNYVTVLVQGITNLSSDLNWAHSTSYVQAGAANQTMIGIEGISTGGNIHRNDAYGKQIYFSFYGDNANGECVVGKESIDISFDLERKQVLTKDGRGGSNLIVDLDDATYQTGNLWQGFTNGLVYVSVYADEYVNDFMNVMVTKLGNNDLSCADYCDTVDPVITVDCDEKNLTQGGAGYSYPVFEATAFDDYDGDLPVSVRAFYNYHSNNRFEIGIEDGRFETLRAGLYTLEYTATDRSGNDVVSTIDLSVANTSAPINLEVSAPQGDLYAGEIVELQEAKISGGVGELLLTCRAVNDESGEIFDLENNSFRPLISGTYTVEYSVNDYIGQVKTASYKIEIKENVDPVFMSNAVLPKYFVENSPYILPSLNAVDLLNGNNVNAEITVNDGNGEKTLAGEIYYPKADRNGQAVITYTAVTSTGGNRAVYPIPVISGARNGTTVDLGKYFYSDTLDIVAEESGYKFIASDESVPNAGFDYILPLYADGLNVSFFVAEDANDFDSLTIILTDVVDRTKTVRFTFEKALNSSVLKINGETVSESASGFNGTLFQLVYSNSAYTITDGTNILGTVSTYENATPFNGFESGRVYLSMQMENIVSDSAFCITTINGQRFNSSITTDTVRPAMFVEHEPDVRGYIGQSVSLAKALAIDVLDPYVNSYLTVLDVNGDIVCAEDGTYLNRVAAVKEYSFTVNQYGNYTIVYQAFGSDGRKTEASYSIAVYDDTAPELVLNGTVPSSAKVDERVTLPSATATDNIDEEVEVHVYVASPSQVLIVAGKDEDGNFSFTPDRKGNYAVRYVAVDTAGNIAALTYSLNVE